MYVTIREPSRARQEAIRPNLAYRYSFAPSRSRLGSFPPFSRTFYRVVGDARLGRTTPHFASNEPLVPHFCCRSFFLRQPRKTQHSAMPIIHSSEHNTTSGLRGATQPMQKHSYKYFSGFEETHWWYIARRRFLSRLMQMYQPAKDRRWLDAGCGAAGNIRSLDGPTVRIGIDFAPEALENARPVTNPSPDGCAPHATKLMCGDISATPLTAESVDLVTCLDVLEHVPDDFGSVREFSRVLAPGGVAVLTVPAHPWMWSELDRVALHKRRYTSATFKELIHSTDWEVVSWGSFNSILFPAIAAVRCAQRILSLVTRATQTQTAAVGGAAVGPMLGKPFHSLFVIEHRLRRLIPRGFGVSFYAVCRKRENTAR